MNVETILDPADARLKDYQGVSDPVLLRERGLFVAEGRLVVERVLASGRYVVESLMLNQASLDSLRPALDSTVAAAVSRRVFLCDTSMFESTTGFNIHRGCLALVRRPPTVRWEAIVADARLVVVLESVTNADNVGTVFRSAAAFGVDAVLLSPSTCDPLYRKAVRTSMGAALSVPFARVEPWPQSIHALRTSGFTIVALSPREPSVPIDEFAAHARCRLILVLGTEGAGISAAVEEAADVRVRIPIRHLVDSLNLGVAAGIALFRLGQPS